MSDFDGPLTEEQKNKILASDLVTQSIHEANGKRIVAIEALVGKEAFWGVVIAGTASALADQMAFAMKPDGWDMLLELVKKDAEARAPRMTAFRETQGTANGWASRPAIAKNP